MPRLISIGTAAALVFAGAAVAKPIAPDDGVPTYECRRGGPIVVDGRLDDPAWERAVPTPPFVFPWPAQTGAKQETITRLLWDDQCLYVCYECQDTDITATYNERDDPVYKDDCVEVFIAAAPEKSRFYFGFEMNCSAVLYDYFYAHPEAFVALYDTGGVRLKTQINGTPNDPSDTDRGWTLELAIPFANFRGVMRGDRPAAGDVWRINMNRWDGTSPDRALSQWSPSGKERPDPHRPEGFGALVFVAE